MSECVVFIVSLETDTALSVSKWLYAMSSAATAAVLASIATSLWVSKK